MPYRRPRLCRSQKNQGPNTLASNGSQVPPPAHPFSTSRSTMSKIQPDHDRSSTGEPDRCIVILRSEERKPTGSRWQASFLALSADRVKPFFRPLHQSVGGAMSGNDTAPIHRGLNHRRLRFRKAAAGRGPGIYAAASGSSRAKCTGLRFCRTPSCLGNRAPQAAI